MTATVIESACADLLLLDPYEGSYGRTGKLADMASPYHLLPTPSCNHGGKIKILYYYVDCCFIKIHVPFTRPKLPESIVRVEHFNQRCCFKPVIYPSKLMLNRGFYCTEHTQLLNQSHRRPLQPTWVQSADAERIK